MRQASWSLGVVSRLSCWAAACPAGEARVPAARPLDAAAVERGRVALTLQGFLKPEWYDAAYRRAARLWDELRTRPRP